MVFQKGDRGHGDYHKSFFYKNQKSAIFSPVNAMGQYKRIFLLNHQKILSAMVGRLNLNFIIKTINKIKNLKSFFSPLH